MGVGFRSIVRGPYHILGLSPHVYGAEPPYCSAPLYPGSTDSAESAAGSPLQLCIESTASSPDEIQSTGERNPMGDKIKQSKTTLDTVEPLGKRVLIRKDEDKRVTKGGIELPDSIEIPTITGRVVAISAQIEHDDDFPIRQYDRVLFNPKNAIPVEFDAGNYLYVVPIDDVVAVFRKNA